MILSCNRPRMSVRSEGGTYFGAQSDSSQYPLPLCNSIAVMSAIHRRPGCAAMKVSSGKVAASSSTAFGWRAGAARRCRLASQRPSRWCRRRSSLARRGRSLRPAAYEVVHGGAQWPTRCRTRRALPPRLGPQSPPRLPPPSWPSTAGSSTGQAQPRTVPGGDPLDPARIGMQVHPPRLFSNPRWPAAPPGCAPRRRGRNVLGALPLSALRSTVLPRVVIIRSRWRGRL
jgi:hypothetical protein